MQKHILLVSILALSSCQFFQSESKTNQEVTEQNTSLGELTFIDFDTTVLLKEVVITNRKGAVIFTDANDKAKQVTTMQFGQWLEVIEEQAAWYAIRLYVGNEIDTDSDIQSERIGWVRLFVKKADVGSGKDLKLTETDLYVLNDNFAEGNVSEEKIRQVLQMEIVDKSTYLKAQTQSVNQLLSDTLAVKKINGALSFIAQDHSVTVLKDNDSDSDDLETYEYMGQIEALQKYVVWTNYHEMSNFILIDKRNGLQKTYIGFPYLSSDKKHLVTFSPEMEPYRTDFSLFEIDNNQEAKEVFSYSFKYWMPYVGVIQDLFWSADGYFYMPINHTATYWDEGDYNTANSQYIRIKIKQN